MKQSLFTVPILGEKPLTKEEIEEIIKSDKIADIDLMAWLRMVLTKINEWRAKL
jgi:hypothetical protein